MRESIPIHFSTLTIDDQKSYCNYQSIFNSSDYRYSRNHRKEKFKEIIEIIKNFCIRNDPNDQYRCLVCGIFWVQKYLYINVNQLSCLIGKCKSAINQSLSYLGYIRKTKYSGKASIQINHTAYSPIVIENNGENIELLINENSKEEKDPIYLISQSVPFFNQNPKEMKGWTLRYLSEEKPCPKKDEKLNIFDFGSQDFSGFSEDDLYEFFDFDEKKQFY